MARFTKKMVLARANAAIKCMGLDGENEKGAWVVVEHESLYGYRLSVRYPDKVGLPYNSITSSTGKRYHFSDSSYKTNDFMVYLQGIIDGAGY